MRGAMVWEQVVVPVVAPVDWTRVEIRDGLAQLERLRRACWGSAQPSRRCFWRCQRRLIPATQRG